MNKEIILKTFEDVINKHIQIKCESQNKGISNAMHQIGGQYGFEIIENEKDDTAFTLIDHKNNTILDFKKKFINQKYLDYKNNGERKMNLEDLFRDYDLLPDKVKKSIGRIEYVYDEEKNPNYEAYSQIFNGDGDFNVITMPHRIFEKNANHQYILAHEAMHCYDYKVYSQKKYDRLVRIAKDKNIQGFDDVVFLKNTLNELKSDNHFRKSNKMYMTAFNEQLNIAEKVSKGMGMSSELIASSSDYGFLDAKKNGTGKRHEDFAEAGAMIITGYHNPNNPNSTTTYLGGKSQYKEWIVFHTATGKALIKELYGDTLTDKELIESTR